MSNATTHTAKCLHCGRVRHFRTRTAATLARPYGRICRVRVLIAAINEALKGFTTDQAEKARQLLADGGIIATGRKGIYRAVASSGLGTYLVSVKGPCGCPSGLRMMKLKPCYHVASARADFAAKAA